MKKSQLDHLQGLPNIKRVELYEALDFLHKYDMSESDTVSESAVHYLTYNYNIGEYSLYLKSCELHLQTRDTNPTDIKNWTFNRMISSIDDITTLNKDLEYVSSFIKEINFDSYTHDNLLIDDVNELNQYKRISTDIQNMVEWQCDGDEINLHDLATKLTRYSLSDLDNMGYTRCWFTNRYHCGKHAGDMSMKNLVCNLHSMMKQYESLKERNLIQSYKTLTRINHEQK